MSEQLAEALRKIAAIENEQYGGDWDEIEAARLIAITALAAHEAQKAEPAVERFGPTEPDNSMVICPACTSQFRAIPVDVQAELNRRAEPAQGALSDAEIAACLGWPTLDGLRYGPDSLDVRIRKVADAATRRERDRARGLVEALETAIYVAGCSSILSPHGLKDIARAREALATYKEQS